MNELTLSSLLGILRKSIVYIIIAAIVFAIAGYLCCEFIATPTYQAKIALLATNSSGFANQDSEDIGTDSSELSAARSLINTYIDIFSTREFFGMIKEKTGLDYSDNTLKGMVNISRRSDTSLFIDIVVTSANKKHAIIVADAIYEYSDDYLVSLLPAASVKGVEKSGSRAVQNYPNTSSAIFLAAVLGGVLTFVVFVIINIMDKTIKGEKDFSANYDIPILGNIPNFKVAAREEKK